MFKDTIGIKMVKLAFVGDVHGKINQMYWAIKNIEEIVGYKIDTVYQVGDFHAIRNEEDLNRFRVPAVHRALGDFPEFFKQDSVPVKTYFLGGNHENYFWLSQFPLGKEVIQNLFYLGRAGVYLFDKLTIGWVSGTYSPNAFNGNKIKPHHFTPDDLSKVPSNVDILLLHDWPSMSLLSSGIDMGSVSNLQTLEEAISRKIGSKELYDLLVRVKPHHVFCGHLHFPLSLEIKLEDESKVNFVALGEFPYNNSVAIFDTERKKIDFFNSNFGNEVSIVPVGN